MEHSAVFASYVDRPWQPSQHDRPESIVRGLAPHFWKAALKLKRPESWDAEDLLQVALLAALECASKFDPSRGTPFGSYAITVGRRAMLDACAEGHGIMRIPAKMSGEYASTSRIAQKGAIRLDALKPNGKGVYHDLISGPECVSLEDMAAMKQVVDRLPTRAVVSLEKRAMGDVIQAEVSSQAESASEKAAIKRAVGGEAPKRRSEQVGSVSWVRSRSRWRARVGKKYLGQFISRADAEKALADYLAA